MLHELMTLNDVDFVRAAYRLLLGREPDPDGERNYLGLLRAGKDKAFVLGGIAGSDEGRAFGANVPGLSSVLRWGRVGRLPFIGRLALGLRRSLRSTPDPDPDIAFRNDLIGMQRATLDLAEQLLALAKEAQLRQAGMERALARLDRRQAEAGRPRG